MKRDLCWTFLLIRANCKHDYQAGVRDSLLLELLDNMLGNKLAWLMLKIVPHFSNLAKITRYLCCGREIGQFLKICFSHPIMRIGVHFFPCDSILYVFYKVSSKYGSKINVSTNKSLEGLKIWNLTANESWRKKWPKSSVLGIKFCSIGSTIRSIIYAFLVQLWEWGPLFSMWFQYYMFYIKSLAPLGQKSLFQQIDRIDQLLNQSHILFEPTVT